MLVGSPKSLFGIFQVHNCVLILYAYYIVAFPHIQKRTFATFHIKYLNDLATLFCVNLSAAAWPPDTANRRCFLDVHWPLPAIFSIEGRWLPVPVLYYRCQGQGQGQA